MFLIEDLHTSYWPNSDGGLHRPGTFMEYAKPLTDQLNAHHSRQEDFAVDAFTRTTRSMHFYDSIVVFEKGTVKKPRRWDGGVPGWERRPETTLSLSPAARLRAPAVTATDAIRSGGRAARSRLAKAASRLRH